MSRVPHTIECAVTGVPRVIDLVRLVQHHGYVRLRGLVFSSSNEFHSRYGYLIGDCIGHQEHPHQHRPPWLYEDLHHIGCDGDEWPQLCIMYCVKNTLPKNQGLVRICNNKTVTENLPSDLFAKLMDLGIKYIRNEIDVNHFGIGQGVANGCTTWQSTFGTESKVEVERLCHEKKYRYQWLADGNLKYEYQRPAFVEHPVHGDLCLFHNVVSGVNWYSNWKPFSERKGTERPFWNQWGDGRDFSDYEMRGMKTLYEEHTLSDSWQKGDVVIFDNHFCSIGRTSYIGGRDQRDIGLFMGNKTVRKEISSVGIGKCRVEYSNNSSTIAI